MGCTIELPLQQQQQRAGAREATEKQLSGIISMAAELGVPAPQPRDRLEADVVFRELRERVEAQRAGRRDKRLASATRRRHRIVPALNAGGKCEGVRRTPAGPEGHVSGRAVMPAGSGSRPAAVNGALLAALVGLLTAAGLDAALGGQAAAVVDGTDVVTGIEYGRGATRRGDRPLRLDLYRPDAVCTAPRPLVVMIHGGGFRRGARDHPPWPGFATDLAAAGYVAASIDYRLQGDDPVPSPPFAAMWPDWRSRQPGRAAAGSRARRRRLQARAAVSAFEDTAVAIHWLRDNAAGHCIDPGRIALWGASAGAITALQTAYALDDYGIWMPTFTAVVDLWGGLPVDVHLEPGEAPLFIVHGTRDTVVPYRETLLIEARAREVGVPVEVHAIEGAGHGFKAIDIRTRTVDGATLLDRIHAFLDHEFEHAAGRR